MSINYAHEALTYLKLLGKKQKISQVKYCFDRSSELETTVVLRTFRKHLAIARKSTKPKKSEPKIDQFRHPDGAYDWESLKTTYLSGAWRTVAEFGRAIGAKTRSARFLSSTVGWQSEKKQLNKQVTARTAEMLVENRAAEQVQDLLGDVRLIYWRVLNTLKMTLNATSNWQQSTSPFSSLTSATYLKTVVETTQKLVPSLQGIENMTKVNDIFHRLRTGKIDVAESSVEFAMLGVQLPEVIKIMLSKGIGEDVPDDDGELVTNEKIQERRRALLAEVEKERIEFVEIRTREVNEIKEELKDIGSFDKEKILTDADTE